MKRKLIATFSFLAVVVILLLLTACSATYQREFKDWQSDISGGLNRTVKVYSNDGTEIGIWQGKIDVDVSESGRIKFDLDGKRTIIAGGTVIIQED